MTLYNELYSRIFEQLSIFDFFSTRFISNQLNRLFSSIKYPHQIGMKRYYVPDNIINIRFVGHYYTKFSLKRILHVEHLTLIEYLDDMYLLSQCQQLKSIELNIDIDDECIGCLVNLPYLEKIRLPRWAKITDKTLLYLSQMKNLKSISFGEVIHTNFTLQGIENLYQCQQLEELDVIDLHYSPGCRIGVDILKNFKNLKRLKCGSVNYNLENVDQLTNIVDLTVFCSNVSQRLIDEIYQLNNLKRLSINFMHSSFGFGNIKFKFPREIEKLSVNVLNGHNMFEINSDENKNLRKTKIRF